MNPIKVGIPANYSEERQYILSVFLTHFLGIPFFIQETTQNFWILSLDDKNEIWIKDSFFSEIPANQSYLKSHFLPKKVQYQNSLIKDKRNLIVLYGEPIIESLKDDAKHIIYLQNDFFAAGFLMLTRWEEFVFEGSNDRYGRMPENEMLAFKFGFHQRPIINEYIEELKDLIRYLRPDFRLKETSYQLIPSHDIDYLHRYPSTLSWLKSVAATFLRGFGLGVFLQTWHEGMGVLYRKKQDPFQNLDYLMDASRNLGLKPEFYFKTGLAPTDYRIDDSIVQILIQKVLARGNEVGIHPDFNSCNSFSTYRKEIEVFRSVYPGLQKSRQHYLQIQPAITWPIQESLGLKIDATIGYSSDWGFRSGICNSYPLFDILSRRMMDLMEEPFIVMDTAIFRSKLNADDFALQFELAANLVKRYQGEMRFIWHNNHFALPEWKAFTGQYESILKAMME